MGLLELLWSVLVVFLVVSYLMLLFSILGDLLRDSATSGWAKAGWVLGLVVVPFVTALGYLVVRGDGMARRTARTALLAREAQEAWIRDVSTTTSPADQIAGAKRLLDAGAVSPDEFAALKMKALA